MKHNRTLLPAGAATPNFTGRFSLLMLAVLISARHTALAASTLINFDDVAGGTLINTHYAGVTFTNPLGGNVYARYSGSAPSPTNVVVLTTNSAAPPFFDAVSGAVDASFSTPMRTVSIDVRPVSQVADHTDPTTRRPFLEAYDASGVLIGSVKYAGVLPQGCCNEVGATETLTLTLPSGNIKRARFSSQAPTNTIHTYGLFDNLRFDDGYYDVFITIVGSGTVSISPFPGPYFYGSSVGLGATPSAGWSFKDWTGSISTTQSSILVNMDTNKYLTATFIPTPQTGPNFVVTTNDDHDDGDPGVVDCTLREAINAANANADASTITFAANVTGVITLTLGELTINQNVTILGPGAKVLAVNVNNSSAVAHISGGAVAAISGLGFNNFVVGFNSYYGMTVDAGSTLSLASCKVSGFRDTCLRNSGTLVLNNSTVSGNSGDSGGGIRNYGTTAITNSTLSGNGATTGGGIYNQGTLTLISSTVCSNYVPSASGSGGGGIRNTVGTVNIGNTLIAGNMTSGATGPDCDGSFTSLGYNLIGKTNSSSGFVGGVNEDQVGSIASPLNPKLAPLADNGGLTLTHALLTGSPAIDKGKSFGLATDQRGWTRPFDFPGVTSASGGDGSDIGAVELNPPVLNIVKSLSNVVISWPTNQIGFTLQSAAQLTPPLTWTTVPTGPVIIGGQYTVTTTAAGQQFYRLFGMGVATIPGLFNTGIGANGVILASGTVDPHWQLVRSADPDYPGPNAIVVTDAVYPIPPWLANGPASKWLAPQASQGIGNLGGDYKYRITFDLTGLEPSTAVITGRWTSDDSGPQVTLNGVTTGVTSDGNFTVLGNAFTISSGFIAGVNSLVFVVTNGGTSANPTGVRVELSGTANFQPLP